MQFRAFVLVASVRTRLRRKRKGVAKILEFIGDFGRKPGQDRKTAAGQDFVRVMKRFRYAVVKAQRLVKSFLACQRARRRAIGCYFDRHLKHAGCTAASLHIC